MSSNRRLLSNTLESGSSSGLYAIYNEGTQYVQLSSAIIRAYNYPTSTNSSVVFDEEYITCYSYDTVYYPIITIVFTSNKLDITNYNTINLTYDFYDNDTSLYDAKPNAGIFLANSIIPDTTNNNKNDPDLFVVYVRDPVSRVSSVDKRTISLDISSYLGEYYIGIPFGMNKTVATIRIYSIILSK